MERERKPINVKLVGIGFGVLCIIIILAAILANVLRKNPYGNEIVIDNFSDYVDGAPRERKDAMFAGLYGIVVSNSNEDATILSSGALIRDGSVEKGYSQEDKIYYARFIVDVPFVKQSYSGYVAWGNGSDADMDGYTTLYTCLPKSKLIYGDFDCKDMFSDTTTVLYPITSQLPLTVEYYENNYSVYVKYVIKYEINDEDKSLTLNILDYTGGNRDKALAKIRELGYSPEDFTIQYKDVSSEYKSVYVGD